MIGIKEALVAASERNKVEVNFQALSRIEKIKIPPAGRAKFKATLVKGLTGDLTKLIKRKKDFTDSDLSKLKNSKRTDWKSDPDIGVFVAEKYARGYMTHKTLDEVYIILDVVDFVVKPAEVHKG